MNILELPREILLEIWSSVKRIDDIIRFGATCKRIQQLAFEVDNRDVFIDQSASFDVIRNILSRDLRHLRTLSLRATKFTEDEVLWLQNRITVLSTLPNMKKFVCHLYRDNRIKTASGDPTIVQTIRDTIQKMTWLESVNASFPTSDDYGALFKEHTRLTKLVIFSTIEQGDPVGFGRLSQIKSIALPVQAGDRIFAKVVEMTNLTALDISWTDITNDSAMDISKLTNLEKIDISGVQELTWDTLLALPKLKNLQFEVGYNQQIEEISKLTQLTRLVINSSEEDQLLPSYIAKLTNLQSLYFGVRCDAELDFSMLEKLTELSCPDFKFENYIHLPRGLKVLELERMDEHVLISAFNIETITKLTMQWHSSDEIMQISRLTNLKELSFAELPRGIGNSLSKLPMLRNMHLNTIYERNMNDLVVATQLCRLVVNEIKPELHLRTLRQQLPFSVYKQ